jgi:lysophospholipase L1-like esterase/acetyl esterase/lipase
MNNKKFHVLVLWALLSLPLYLFGQQPSRTVYAVKGTDTLWFDHYRPRAASNGISVLFVHGGGFTGGDPAGQAPFAEGLSKMGYNIFVIKYRLYLKGKSFGCETALPEKMKAIRLAVEDTWDATTYLRQHAANLQVDTAKLFLAGSSAGAETVLNLVFNPFVSKEDTTYKSFRYAGLMSFAGAVLDMNRVYAKPALPLLMMHGTNDQLVPYATAGHHYCNATDPGWVIMSGSFALFTEMQKKNLPVTLYTYEGKGHEVSGYMARKFKEMDDFMQNAIQGKQQVPVHIIEKAESTSAVLQYDTTYSTTYYRQKVSQFRLIRDTETGEIIFLGDSITDFAEWADLFKNNKMKNRGISGDRTRGILNRLDEVINRKPAKVFIMIGINDIAANIPDSVILQNYTTIIQRLRTALPATGIYIQSILPTNGTFPEFPRHQRKEEHIHAINTYLQQLAAEQRCIYVDLYHAMLDSEGRLNKQYTNDGLHLTGEGYLVWKKVLLDKQLL